MSAELNEFCAAKGLDASSVTLEQLQAALAEQPKEEVHVAEMVNPEQLQARADEIIAEDNRRVAENESRIAQIKKICAGYEHPEIEVDGNLVSLQAHATTENWDAQKTEFECMKWKLDKNSAGGAAPIHDATAADADVDVIECSLSLTAGLSESAAGKLYDQKIVDIATQSRFRGMRPSELVNRTLRAAGMATSSRLNNEYIRNMKAAHTKLQASGFTTISVPGILSNVAQKRLIAAYTRAPSFIPFVFGRTSKTDFKLAYAYQLEGEGRLLPIGGDGEIKHGKVIESEYTSKLETYARMLAWTREDMINDDLGALGRTADMLGTMAFKAREFAAAQFIIEPSATFWNAVAANGPVNSFAARNLDHPGMTESDESFDGITDSEGLPISVGGGQLLVPHTLKTEAADLRNSRELRVGGGDTSTAKQTITNTHYEMFEYRSTPWIANAVVNQGLTNAANATTTWYRFADPESAPAMIVSYLNGQDTPTIESDETDFNTLGMQFRCYFDFGFGVQDPRHAQRNIGA